MFEFIFIKFREVFVCPFVNFIKILLKQLCVFKCSTKSLLILFLRFSFISDIIMMKITSCSSDISPFATTLYFLLNKKLWFHVPIFPFILWLITFYPIQTHVGFLQQTMLFHVSDLVNLYHSLKYFHNMRCQTYWSVICRVHFLFSFMKCIHKYTYLFIYWFIN